MLIPNTYYHIYNHGNGDDNLFREEKNYPYFLEKYEYHIGPIAETIAWCLMPNHFHLLVRIKDINELQKVNRPDFSNINLLDEKAVALILSRQFSNFFNSYTKAFNKVYKRRGSLFLKNFKRKSVLDDDYLRTLIIYIHLNPIKHGFTRRLSDWEYNSYLQFWEDQTELRLKLFKTKIQFEQLHLNKLKYFKEYTDIEKEISE